MAKTLHVFPSPDGKWTLKKEGGKAKVFVRKKDAVADARERVAK